MASMQSARSTVCPRKLRRQAGSLGLYVILAAVIPTETEAKAERDGADPSRAGRTPPTTAERRDWKILEMLTQGAGREVGVVLFGQGEGQISRQTLRGPR